MKRQQHFIHLTQSNSANCHRVSSLWQLISGVSYHHKGAVKVETLPAALGHHVPAPPMSVLQHGPDEQQQAETRVGAQEQQLPAVVVPVGPGQVARSVALLLILVRGLQPVRSTEQGGGQLRDIICYLHILYLLCLEAKQ